MINKLTERIERQSRTVTPDTIGGQSVTWAKVGDLWAGVKPMNAFRAEEFAKTIEGTPYEVLLRREDSEAIEPDDRLIWEGRILVIHGTALKDKRTVLVTAYERK